MASITIHPNSICPALPAAITPEDRAELINATWTEYNEAVRAFALVRDRATGVAMALAYGRFVGAFVDQEGGANG